MNETVIIQACSSNKNDLLDCITLILKEFNVPVFDIKIVEDTTELINTNIDINKKYHLKDNISITGIDNFNLNDFLNLSKNYNTYIYLQFPFSKDFQDVCYKMDKIDFNLNFEDDF